MRTEIRALSCILTLLDDQETLEVGLLLISTLCHDCDAALEFGLKGLHQRLMKLSRISHGDFLDLVYDTIQAAADGLPPGHSFPMEQELEGHAPPPPHTFHIHNVRLKIRCDTSLRLHSQGDVGRLLWPAALVMARWIIRTFPNWLPGHKPLAPCKLLELGAGVGLTGLAAAHLVSHVTLSDWDPIVLANLRYNAALVMDQTKLPKGLNKECSVLPQEHRVVVSHLDWNLLRNDGMKYNVIIGSDIVCSENDGRAVAKVIASLLEPTGVAYIVLPPSWVRWGVEVFISSAQDFGLKDTVQKVDITDISADESPDKDDEEDIAIGGGYEKMLEIHKLSWKS